MANAAIYNALIQPIRGVADYREEAEGLKARGEQRAMNALMMQAKQMELGQARQQMEQQNALMQALQAAPQGASEADLINVARGLRTPAGLTWADTRAKAKAEADKAAADVGKVNAETQAKWAALMKERANGLAATPTLEAAMAYVNEMEQLTGRPAAMDRQLLAQAKTPDDIKRYAVAVSQGADKVLAKLQTTNYGGFQAQEAVDPITGKVSRTGEVKNTQTPDNAASNARMAADAAASRAVTMRGQNLSDSRAREFNDIQKQAQRSQVVETQDGVMIVDKGTGLARPAATFNGQGLPGKQPEAVRKELMSINQQRAMIDGALKAVEGAPSAFGLGRGMATMAGAIPESVAGRMDSDAERQARSFVFNNVSAVINERAGAAQSAQELARLRSFLPAETDNAAQIKSKFAAFNAYLADKERGTRSDTSKPTEAKPGRVVDFGSLK